jgi:hypothetical protein
MTDQVNILGALTVLGALTGCASLVAQSPASGYQVFRTPEAQVGQLVEVSGFLRWTFEDRNLYPTSNHDSDRKKKRCLPLGISRSDIVLMEKAKQLDGSRVIVSGTVERLVSGEELSFSFCRDVGIRVSQITQAR